MPQRLTEGQCRALIAQPLVGVIGLNNARLDDRGAILAPMWYLPGADGSIRFTTLPDSRKGRRLRIGTRTSLLVVDRSGYRYATVEGPITDIHPTERDERVAIAGRYLPEQAVTQYLAATRESQAGNRTYTITPDRVSGVSLFDVGSALDLVPAGVGSAAAGRLE